MRLRLQVTFRHMEPLSVAETWIQEEAAKLETFYNRIMRCHVIVEVPHSHHRKGSQYQVRIDLTVPGGEIVIKHAPSLSKRPWQEGQVELTKGLELDAEHKSLRQAINDAFRAAGRRLQDYARRQHGDVKHHERMPQTRAAANRPRKTASA